MIRLPVPLLLTATNSSLSGDQQMDVQALSDAEPQLLQLYPPGAVNLFGADRPRGLTRVSLYGSGRNELHLSIWVLGQDDIHGMCLIKGLHHLDAIAQ